jgi:hypothetical protein
MLPLANRPAIGEAPMTAREMVLFVLAATLLLSAGAYASPEGRPPSPAGTAAGSITPVEREQLKVETVGALYLLIAEPWEEAGEVFQDRFASIERRVGDDPAIQSLGGWVGYIQPSVLELFSPDLRIELGRKLVGLTQKGSLKPRTFFELISLGGFLVLSNDAEGQYIAEIARRIAAQATQSEYNPETLLQYLITSIGMLDPAGSDSPSTIKRHVSFFYCLRDCLTRSGDPKHPELLAGLDASVRTYLCESRGESADCKKDVEEMAKSAHFPRCPGN